MATPPFNENNYIRRKDYGVKVARPYYDVRSCADNQLLFNSSWPILQIVGVFKESLISGSVPAGATVTFTQTIDYDYCAASKEVVYTKRVNIVYNLSGNISTVTQYWGYRHNLGYAPLAFPSSVLSGLSGYIVITNIDISKDVDYPYTDAPLEYFGGDLDYGVKTKAYYRKDMPHSSEILGYGINSRLSSKMVQAVKTEETIQAGTVNNKYIYWEPPRDEQDNVISGVDAFEFYGYGTEDGSDVYYPVQALYLPSGVDASGAEYVGVFSPQYSADYSQTSLVVLRSPMVSPNVVEVNYGS